MDLFAIKQGCNIVPQIISILSNQAADYPKE